eukprot:SAG11_NODE_36301_length_262_cov_0.840491_1_plen_28_part_01
MDLQLYHGSTKFSVEAAAVSRYGRIRYY